MRTLKPSSPLPNPDRLFMSVAIAMDTARSARFMEHMQLLRRAA